MNKYIYIRLVTAGLSGLVFAGAFLALLYVPVFFDLQIAALLQRVLLHFSAAAIVLLLCLLLATFLFGRLYCSTLCPLGLFQEFLTIIFRRKGKAHSSGNGKYFLAIFVWGSLLGGTAFFLRLLDPYTLSGSAVSGAIAGLAAVVIITVLVWFKGRFFCTNICPVGILLGLIGKHAVNKIYIAENDCVSCGLCASVCPSGSIDFKNKTVDNETCVKCLKCLSICHKNSLHYGRVPVAEVPFNPGRRRFLIGGALVATFALAFKSGLEMSKLAAAKVKNVILPPGAGSADNFANRCLNCNLCVQNCPAKIIKKANADYPAVHLDYADAFCDYNCNRCSALCPSGALEKLSLPRKQNIQIGQAAVNESVCIRCGLCISTCPRGIIRREEGGFPQISPDDCIGCGACVHACPVKAITVSASVKQRLLS